MQGSAHAGGAVEAADHRHDTARMVADTNGNVAGARGFADRRIVAGPAVLGQIDLGLCVGGAAADL
jgi:hypothetical protein